MYLYHGRANAIRPYNNEILKIRDSKFKDAMHRVSRRYKVAYIKKGG